MGLNSLHVLFDGWRVHPCVHACMHSQFQLWSVCNALIVSSILNCNACVGVAFHCTAACMHIYMHAHTNIPAQINSEAIRCSIATWKHAPYAMAFSSMSNLLQWAGKARSLSCSRAPTSTSTYVHVRISCTFMYSTDHTHLYTRIYTNALELEHIYIDRCIYACMYNNVVIGRQL